MYAHYISTKIYTGLYAEQTMYAWLVLFYTMQHYVMGSYYCIDFGNLQCLMNLIKAKLGSTQSLFLTEHLLIMGGG